MPKYEITFANGDAPIRVEAWMQVEDTLRAKYGHDVSIGHDGDLFSGGDRTLFWNPGEEDDGQDALGSVWKVER